VVTEPLQLTGDEDHASRPLEPGLAVRALGDGRPDDASVQTVDRVVEPGQRTGEVEVALREGLDGRLGETSGLGSHLEELLAYGVVAR